MIEVGFAIILGFAITSTLCGLMADGSRGDRILIRALVYVAALVTLVAMYHGQNVRFFGVLLGLALGSVFVHLPWFLLGAGLALCVQLLVEGHGHYLWVRFHPQSAPTPEAGIGQRSYESTRRKKVVPATLVGVSTEYLSTDLDLRTETLIRLCFFAFEARDALMLSRLETILRLGTGRKQKAFHKLAAGIRGREKVSLIIHRYWRSVNGSNRMGLTLFSDLCGLARDTDNRDRATIRRLMDVGVALGFTSEDSRKFIQQTL